MQDYCKYVNVFQGNGELNLPLPDGIAESWHFIKALSGNTHPGAVLPFGKLSCCAYSAGYSSGYGCNKMNCGGKIKKLSRKKRIKGFSHLHNSGTGALGRYFNYAVSTPFYGDLKQARVYHDLFDEAGRPGYYSAVLGHTNIKGEVTVSEKCAYHRYSFTKDGGRVCIHFTNDGLYDNADVRGVHGDGCIEIGSDHEVMANVVLQDVRLYFHVRLEGAACKVKLWKNYRETDQTKLRFHRSKSTYGCVFDVEEGKTVTIKLAVSARSAERARQDVLAETRSFDKVCGDAYSLWNTYLGKIEIETDREQEKEIFYSNLYHSLIKPCNWENENFITDSDGDFMIDFCTLWDQYKTQLPLIFSLYPEASEKIVRTYLTLGETLGFLPNCFVLCRDYHIETQQACALPEHMLLDAWHRNIRVTEDKKLLDILCADMNSDAFEVFNETGCFDKTTKILDASEAAHAIADFAEKTGEQEIARQMRRRACNWIHAFDRTTGLLRADSDYYEGNLWNYSFRPLHDNDERVALAGGKEAYVRLLDRFFGYTEPEDTSARFEGFNNETDMESPYAYLYGGRHDRVCEVITAGLDLMFTSGSGGLPGNNDSGGLSSCYVWNAIGLFPVSGQDVMLCGTPRFDRVTMHLSSGKDFIIQKQNKDIYINRVTLDGEEVDNFTFSVSRMMNGGTMIFYE